jgi:hypothetical protein
MTRTTKLLEEADESLEGVECRLDAVIELLQELVALSTPKGSGVATSLVLTLGNAVPQ